MMDIASTSLYIQPKCGRSFIRRIKIILREKNDFFLENSFDLTDRLEDKYHYIKVQIDRINELIAML